MDDERSETSIVCPSCLVQGLECVGPTKVPRITLTNLIRPEYQEDIPSGETFFCTQKDCETVYFDVDGRQIKKHQLSVKVWQKEKPGDVLVCYCFGFTAKDILGDARRNLPPTIPFVIRDKIRADLCACEIKNPKGSCCLGDVAFWVKQS